MKYEIHNLLGKISSFVACAPFVLIRLLILFTEVYDVK
jgi:hypothetical protein